MHEKIGAGSGEAGAVKNRSQPGRSLSRKDRSQISRSRSRAGAENVPRACDMLYSWGTAAVVKIKASTEICNWPMLLLIRRLISVHLGIDLLLFGMIWLKMVLYSVMIMPNSDLMLHYFVNKRQMQWVYYLNIINYKVHIAFRRE
jgi:hypothetical protein